VSWLCAGVLANSLPGGNALINSFLLKLFYVLLTDKEKDALPFNIYSGDASVPNQGFNFFQFL